MRQKHYNDAARNPKGFAPYNRSCCRAGSPQGCQPQEFVAAKLFRGVLAGMTARAANKIRGYKFWRGRFLDSDQESADMNDQPEQPTQLLIVAIDSRSLRNKRDWLVSAVPRDWR